MIIWLPGWNFQHCKRRIFLTKSGLRNSIAFSAISNLSILWNQSADTKLIVVFRITLVQLEFVILAPIKSQIQQRLDWNLRSSKLISIAFKSNEIFSIDVQTESWIATCKCLVLLPKSVYIFKLWSFYDCCFHVILIKLGFKPLDWILLRKNMTSVYFSTRVQNQPVLIITCVCYKWLQGYNTTKRFSR